MGNYSWLVATLNGAAQCRIDWDACKFENSWSTHSEGYHVTSLKDLDPKDPTTTGDTPVDPGDIRPDTVEDLANALNDRKLFGYLDDGYVEAFREICRHMSMTDGSRSFPRMYFEEEGWMRLHYIEFHPGTDIVMLGTLSYSEKEDLPDYEGAPPRDSAERENGEWDPTDEQYRAWKLSKNATFMRWIEEGDPKRWSVQQMLPQKGECPALLVLMSMFGIRPEDPDALEQAAKHFDVIKAFSTPASVLFSSSTNT